MAERNAESMPSGHGSASGPEPAGQVDQDALRALLDEARTEADRQREESEGYRDRMLRAQADYVNFKRRVEADRASQAQAVQAETIQAFLPIVDDLGRALAHVPAEVQAEGWVQGFLLIERNLAAALDRLGVQRIGAEGDLFDPNVHEAVAYEEHPTQPEGHVTSVIRPGYLLGERVVRPAQVAVARATEQAGKPGWPDHQIGRAHGNGGIDRADLQRPRGIERG